MAVSVIKGATGNVALKDSSSAAVNARIVSISVNTGQAVFDTSAFDPTKTYATFEGGGLKMLSGSAAGFIIEGLAKCNPLSFVDQVANMVITFNTTSTITFAAIISNVTLGLTRAGVGVLQFDWVHEGASDPTVAWLES